MQIAEDLRGQIKEGRYQPGDKLPSNLALRDQYGSAYETVRRSLALLRDEGLVETHSTRGTFVLKPPGEPEPDPRFAQLEAALREYIDSEIARLSERVEYDEARLEALETARNGEDAAQGWSPR